MEGNGMKENGREWIGTSVRGWIELPDCPFEYFVNGEILDYYEDSEGRWFDVAASGGDVLVLPFISILPLIKKEMEYSL